MRYNMYKDSNIVKDNIGYGHSCSGSSIIATQELLRIKFDAMQRKINTTAN